MVKVKRKYLAMGADEFQKEFARPPRARILRHHPTMVVLVRGDSSGNVCMFNYKLRTQHRVVGETNFVASVRQRRVLGSDCDLHQSQAADT